MVYQSVTPQRGDLPTTNADEAKQLVKAKNNSERKFILL